MIEIKEKTNTFIIYGKRRATKLGQYKNKIVITLIAFTHIIQLLKIYLT